MRSGNLHLPGRGRGGRQGAAAALVEAAAFTELEKQPKAGVSQVGAMAAATAGVLRETANTRTAAQGRDTSYTKTQLEPPWLELTRTQATRRHKLRSSKLLC